MSQPWHLGELAAFDVETTGTDVESDRIVTATVAHIVPGQQPQIASHLIAVDVDIPPEASEVHGITTEHARANGKPASEVLEAVAAQLTELWANAIPIVVMNGVFDLTVLDRELRRNGLTPITDRLGRMPGPVVDILVIDRFMDQYRRGKRRLADLCEVYGVRHDGAHDATNDALAAARVAYMMGQRGQQALNDLDAVARLYQERRYPYEIAQSWAKLAQVPVDRLHEGQIHWYRQQALSLSNYWHRTANQMEDEAERAHDEAERAVKLRDAEELRRRADNVTTDWPMVPFGGAR